MILLLDTNIVSALRRPERAPLVLNWLERQEPSDLYLSVITLGEIERGIAQQRKRNPEFAADLRAWVDETVMLFSDRILPFGVEEARIWGDLSARLGHDGADLLIAATALARNGAVVTQNGKDFAPTGVTVINPVTREA